MFTRRRRRVNGFALLLICFFFSLRLIVVAFVLALPCIRFFVGVSPLCRRWGMELAACLGSWCVRCAESVHRYIGTTFAYYGSNKMKRNEKSKKRSIVVARTTLIATRWARTQNGTVIRRNEKCTRGEWRKWENGNVYPNTK